MVIPVSVRACFRADKSSSFGSATWNSTQSYVEASPDLKLIVAKPVVGDYIHFNCSRAPFTMSEYVGRSFAINKRTSQSRLS
jgi:hypothetical protein